MDTKRWLIAAIGAFAAIFVLDFVVHGVLLMGIYEQTASVWRPKAEANQMMWMMTLGQLLFGAALAWLYTKGYERSKAGLGQGLRFGIYAGLFLAAANNFVWYVVLPVPFALNLAWQASALVNCMVAGAVVGALYKPQ